MRLIDADALSKKLCETTIFIKDGGVFQRMINDTPTVQADRPHGEWQDKEVFNETDDDHIVDEWQSARCSVCGKYHTTPYMYYFDNFNFCPNCGADMRKEKECL